MPAMIEQLRKLADFFIHEGTPDRADLCEAAAAEIERLRSRLLQYEAPCVSTNE